MPIFKHPNTLFWIAIALLYIPPFLLSAPPGSIFWMFGYGLFIIVCGRLALKNELYSFLKATITEPIMAMMAQTTFTISLISCVLSVLAHYAGFGWHAFDTGIFVNNLAHLTQEGTYYSSFLQMHALGDHFAPNLYWLYPLFKLDINPLWLHFLKITSFFLAALLLFRFGRLLEIPPIFNYGVFILFIHHIYLLKALNFEFQPSALALPFVVLAFQWAWQQKWWLLAVDLLFLCGFKEHLPLVFICIGFFVFYNLNFKLKGIFVGVNGIIVGLIIFIILMPEFHEGSNYQSSKFGLIDFWNLKVEFLFFSLLSVGFLPLFRPKTLLYFLPALTMSVISNYKNMASLGFHYHDIGHTAMFVAVLVCIKERNEFIPKFSIQHRDRATLLFLLLLFATHRLSPLVWAREFLPNQSTLSIQKEILQITNTLQQSPEKYPLYIAASSSIYALKYLDLRDLGHLTASQKTPFWIVYPKDTLLLESWERDTLTHYFKHISLKNDSVTIKYMNEKKELQYVEFFKIASYPPK
jgi:uncharacterized membrane protein